MAPRPAFFDSFRVAVSRLPAGLIRTTTAATAAELSQAERRLGRSLPPTFAAFLADFGGADLFHEAFVVAGVGADAPLSLVDLVLQTPDSPGLVFAQAATGDMFSLETWPNEDEPRVWKRPADTEEKWLAGTSFVRWLDALIAREQLLYDSDGEFELEAFEPDGAEVTPVIGLRRAERALKRDPGAAEHHHDHGLALRRLGRAAAAAEAFEKAAALDPANPWPWFDAGRAALAAGRPDKAGTMFERAAEAAARDEAPRLWAWATRGYVEAGDRTRAEAARARALALEPDLAAGLRRAADAAKDEDEDEEAEAEQLASAFAFEAHTLRRRLPVLQASAEPEPTAPKGPDAPRTPPKSGKLAPRPSPSGPTPRPGPTKLAPRPGPSGPTPTPGPNKLAPRPGPSGPTPTPGPTKLAPRPGPTPRPRPSKPAPRPGPAPRPPKTTSRPDVFKTTSRPGAFKTTSRPAKPKR